MRRNNLRYLTVILFFLILKGIQDNCFAKIYINEILASNNSINYDPHYYNFCDWIELFNDGNSAVNLNHYTITDDINIPDKYTIYYSVNIDPHDFYILWTDKKSWYSHTNFALDPDGEFLALFDPNGNLVDSVRFNKQLPDISYGRYPDGGNSFVYMSEPTNNRSNVSGIENVNLISDSVIFSVRGGFFSCPQTIELSTGSSNTEIRYTLDGSWPDSESEIFSSPIYISENTVIRAKSFKNGYLSGAVYTQSYFFNEERNLPVLSLSTDPVYFFHNLIGIYVEGTNGKTGNCTDYPVNYNQDWERSVNFEYYPDAERCAVNQVVGVKIAGRCSRTRPLKSLGIFSREKYGKVGIGEYRYFNSKEISDFKTLLLRNSGTEFYSTYLRCGFMQTLIKDRMDIDYQAYQPVSVYLNGNYWGIHNLREKMNEHYICSNYGINPDDIDLININTSCDSIKIHKGDRFLYDEFMDFITNNDMSIPDNYNYVKTQMDIDEFMNIHIANIYFENEDWPQNNNKLWRSRNVNGKWRWYMFDLDFGFGYWPRSGNTVNWVFQNRWYSRVAYKLKFNEEFRNEFIQRMAGHLNTTFKNERVIHVLDSVQGNIANEMHNHIERWRAPSSYGKWEDNIQVMVDFANNRIPVVVDQMMEEFNLDGTFNLECINNHPQYGQIEINNVDIPNNYYGFYFSNIPVRLTAIPKPGYKFSGWTGDCTNDSDEIFITTDSDFHITANFTSTDPVDDLYINEIVTDNENGIFDDHGEREDWIEIYNANDFEVNIAGLYISDSIPDPAKHRIPCHDVERTRIPPKGYLILYADNDTEQGVLHLPFKLRRSGEEIIISQRVGGQIQPVNSLIYGEQFTDAAFGRLEDGSENLQILTPTPGERNRIDRIRNVYINEAMAINEIEISDQHGEYDDWIEIYNDNDFSVDIGSLFISDDQENLTKHRIASYAPDSTTIPAKDFLILWADNQTEQGILHLDFKLDSDGEQIYLVQPDGHTVIHSLTYQKMFNGISTGCYPETSDHIISMEPTPKEKNIHFNTIKNLYINEIMASENNFIHDEYGEYDDWIEIYNDNSFSVNIGGLFVSDSLHFKMKEQIPVHDPELTTIPPKGHIILWADNQEEQGICHLDFRLKNRGEHFVLTNKDGRTIIDSVTFPNQFANFTYSRQNNSEMWRFMRPTPEVFNYSQIISGLRINEYMTDNASIEDKKGNYYDWIEIYNSNDYVIDIGGLYITDSLGEPDKYRIPSHSPQITSVLPHGYLLIYAGNEPENGILYTNFKLKRTGEQIGLYNYDEITPVDTLTYNEQYENSSNSWIEGSGIWLNIPPTPGEKNEAENVSNLFINEFMARNGYYNADEYGEYDDWIEIYNGNNIPVDIGGLFITDTLGNPTKCRISTTNPGLTTVPPYGFVLLWADKQPEQGALHLDFKLNYKNEDIGLFNFDGVSVLDTFQYGQIAVSQTLGRIADGNSGWGIFNTPTPGYSNVINDFPDIENNLNAVFVYPNPAGENIIFDISVNEPSEVEIKIYNANGNIGLTKSVNINKREQVKINTGHYHLTPGLYFYKLQSEELIITGKIILL